MEKLKTKKKERNSNIELFRIITMFIIVAHHYVVNSGVAKLILDSKLSFNSIYLLLLGWGGKTGINCFVMITGWFMCKSRLTVRRYLKLLFEVEFYRFIMYFVFLITGYSSFSFAGFIKSITGFYSVGTGFTSSFLVFYLFIPFLNILIDAMNKKQHLCLLSLCLFIHTILPTFVLANPAFSYVIWFMIIYLVAAYLRCYPDKFTENSCLWKIVFWISLVLSLSSVLVGAIVERYFGCTWLHYHFVADSNKILALVTAVSSFMFFKNLNIKNNRFINSVAASSFGVLLIHAASDSMRRWLWGDVFNNVSYFDSKYLIIHSIIAICVVYVICTILDMIRIRFIEKPFFKCLDKYLK